MSLAFCAYNLTAGVGNALDAFTRIADHLDLSNERVVVQAGTRRWSRRFPLGRLDVLASIFSGTDDFSFTATRGDDINALNAAMYSNSASYVSYIRTPNRDSMTVYSRQQGDVRDLAERLMCRVPAKYGFGMAWSGSGSFFGYAHGFGDAGSRTGNLLGESETGRWGVVYLQSDPGLFDHGLFRSVYPVNLLTTAHLNRETRGGTVHDLILAHGNWGGITQLADNWFMWWVPLSEINSVREEFAARGLLEDI